MINLFILAAAAAAEKATVFDLKTILVYYAIGCLVLLPFYVLFIIFLCKKRPDVIKRFNEKLDRMLGIEPPAVPAENAPGTKENNEQETTENPKTIEEENDEMGISTMMMRVGDTYKCYVSESDRKFISGTRFLWKNTDNFVGRIDEMSGMFEALKVGETFIECADKRIYYVKVKPNSCDWYAETILKLVLENSDKANITAYYITKRILDLDEESRIITYEGWEAGMKSVTFEYNKRKETVRALVILANNQLTVDSICSNLAEYMNPIEFDKDSKVAARYWVHKTGDPRGESVDYTAFLKLGNDGMLYFGIGECWRIGADEIEIKANPEMIDRSFKNILPSDEVPKAVKTTVTDDKTRNKKTVADASELIGESEGDEPFEDYDTGGMDGEIGDGEDEGKDDVPGDNGEPADPFDDYHGGMNGDEAGFDTSEN